jgi:hypothetical protein
MTLCNLFKQLCEVRILGIVAANCEGSMTGAHVVWNRELVEKMQTENTFFRTKSSVKLRGVKAVG